MKFLLALGIIVVAGLILFTFVLMQQNVPQASTYATVGRANVSSYNLVKNKVSLTGKKPITSCNVEMSYAVDGKTYQLQDSHVMQGNDSCFTPGQKLKVFYNRKNPGDATMVTFTQVYFGILGVLGIMLAGLVLFYCVC